MQTLHFAASVQHQISLLVSGNPLTAFDRYFAQNGVMFANGTIFASSAAEARAKQKPFFDSACEIHGCISDLAFDLRKQLCAFRNRTLFVSSDSVSHQIDGLCWQYWQDGKIAIERYYDGDFMREQIERGILTKPALLL
ncbi:hypothetical protein [Cochlodiniinecator piscidefendens]|uniref:hypothetical protein n=1 Tax=Cochlodiniinecator piscidefendens TaxID=2715756 RepID=UPI00140AB217|nr:hypothetical protein [Cochlodiniinecator piscidefendens]